MAHIEKRGTLALKKQSPAPAGLFFNDGTKDKPARYFPGNFVLNPFGYLTLSARA
ncbi:hypothetical protein [Pseudomonas sp. NPDC087336]|uniref:hypothetical protein n=1 Tax=Pseudomonas sp. NPDC087336 TaxID=3364436 RepID=UPI00381CBDE2